VVEAIGPKPKRVDSEQARQRKSRAHLSLKQMRFVKEYAHLGNGAEAARRAGYSDRNGHVARAVASENLAKPYIAFAVDQEIRRIAAEVTPGRVKRRLDEISHAAQRAGQFGPAVRAEELLGKSIGMWIDQSLQLTGVLNDSHVMALIEVARRRQAEPIDLGDDQKDDASQIMSRNGSNPLE
jgi:hypothetical protein